MSKPPISGSNSTKGLVGVGPIPRKAVVASHNIAGVENLLDTKSVDAWHYKSCFIPDRATESGPVSPNSQKGSQRGWFFLPPRKVGIVPHSFTLEEKLQVQGIFDVGSAVFNINGYYLDNNDHEIIQVMPHDLIVLNETITVPARQVFEYSPTGPQKLHYRVKGVDVLFDSKNQYIEDRDFVIRNYMIHWINGGLRPEFINGQGAVLSIRYYITPIYIASNIPHNLRIILSNDIGHGAFPREDVYAPQLVIVKQSMDLEETLGIDFTNLPNLPEYSSSSNSTGGST